MRDLKTTLTFCTLALALCSAIPATASGNETLVFKEIVIDKVKHSNQLPWDVGIGSRTQPDPYIMIFVNGKPAFKSPVQFDSLRLQRIACDLPEMEPDDGLRIILRDSDTAAKASGSRNTEPRNSDLKWSMEKLNADDDIFIWDGSVADLQRSGPVDLTRFNRRFVLRNDGARRVVVTLK